MDYINAFWVGGLICALTQILLGQDEADARKNHGASGTAAVLWEHLRYIRLFRILPEQEPVYRYWGLEISCGKV